MHPQQKQHQPATAAAQYYGSKHLSQTLTAFIRHLTDTKGTTETN
jgi:hypothetical protein